MNTTLSKKENEQLFNFWLNQVAGNTNRNRNHKGQQLAFNHWKQCIINKQGNFNLQLEIINSPLEAA